MLHLLLALLLLHNAESCYDAQGNEVDWFFQYKMPDGYKTTYTDSNSKRSETLTVTGALDDKENPPALIVTLRSLVKSESKTGRSVKWEPYFMYNDQPDNAQPSSSSGHTKGVVGIGTRPFWLLHSVPNFPSSDGKGTFYFPESEIIFGQTFLCVAIDAANIDDIATQLSYTHPYVYVNQVGDASGWPLLSQILDGSGFITSPGSTSTKKFGSFTHFAKNGNWDDDMYENLIAKTLKSDLVVESWIRGNGEGTYCKPAHPYEVVDVENMMAVDTDGTNITWKETQDHAKWAVTTDSGHPYVCIADINRMKSQRTRGGGALCFENSNLANQMSNSIVKQHKCRGSASDIKYYNNTKL